METEYTVTRSAKRKAFSFLALTKSLSIDVPLVESYQNPNRLFLANGGSISLETSNLAQDENLLLETATPECTSPEDLIRYQLALEQLLVKHTKTAQLDGDTHCIKGVSDAFGKCFGQHESYEMLLASGWHLLGWRAGLVLMLPILIVYQIVATVSLLVFRFLGLLIQGCYRIGRYCRLKFATSNGLQDDLDARAFPAHSLPLSLATSWMRMLHFPIVVALWLNLQCFALWRQRKAMAAFLASRSVLDGAGYVDEDNRFWISQRSALVNRMIGFGSYNAGRPLFRCDCMLRGLCEATSWKLGNYCQLFRQRQRVEIAIGDSGMCQQSQYIRIGATALVLDMIECREENPVPVIRRPIEAIHQFAKDWMLVRSVTCSDNLTRTALEIQHTYASALKGFLSYHPNVPQEAWKIYHQWQTTLNQLAPVALGEGPSTTLLGRVDWISKMWLLRQIPNVTEWASRKKMDVRYHELSEAGYSNRLNATLEIAPLISAESITTAIRMPPIGTPAMARGYLVREFASTDSRLRIGWARAEVWVDGRRRVHRLQP